MKKYYNLLFILFILFSFAACDVEYYDNPNEPTAPPTSSLFNQAMHQSVYDTEDEWFSGRFTLVTMQYWQQSEYGDEDRYAYRESMRETWEDFYANIENFRQVILFNTNEETKTEALAYGSNDNQIACARIMIAWNFNLMADTWGDIPYYSYGSDNESFQALQLAGVDNIKFSPAYASQADIYADILNELSEAADQLNVNEPGFTQGDNLYNGDVAAWRRFANSLRLRIALKIRGVNQSLGQQHIDDAIADGVFTSNADNAGFTFESSDKNAAPFYRAWNVGNRSDFAVGHSFVELLKGNNLMLGATPLSANPFVGIVDPRLPIYAQANSDGEYVGMPVVETSAEAATITIESLPGDAIINTPNYTDIFMEYSEVQFILSELNGWDQTNYENGVRASMEKWGVPAADITTHIAALPPANEENVLTQKYIALYMQAHIAWAEYRRTGYPQTLIQSGETFTHTNPANGSTSDFIFSSLTDATDIPYRMKYPQQEQTLNGDNRSAAVAKLSDGDKQISKLWWDVN